MSIDIVRHFGGSELSNTARRFVNEIKSRLGRRNVRERCISMAWDWACWGCCFIIVLVKWMSGYCSSLKLKKCSFRYEPHIQDLFYSRIQECGKEGLKGGKQLRRIKIHKVFRSCLQGPLYFFWLRYVSKWDYSLFTLRCSNLEGIFNLSPRRVMFLKLPETNQEGRS